MDKLPAQHASHSELNQRQQHVLACLFLAPRTKDRYQAVRTDPACSKWRASLTFMA